MPYDTRLPPNILLLLPDQHRADWLGGHCDLPLRTPNIDALAARGTKFNRAYCPSPLCAPCRASLASGRDYDRCGVPSNRFNYPLDQPTYYQALRDHGYRVAGVGKFDLHKDVSDKENLNWHLDGSRLLEEWGFTDGIDNEGKFDGSSSYVHHGKPRGPYLNFLNQRGLADIYVQEHHDCQKHQDAYITELPDDAYCDNWVARNGFDLLGNLPHGKPWQMVVNFTGPHNPMDVTASMAASLEGVRFPPPHAPKPGQMTDADHQRNRRHYAAMIENIDRLVGQFIDLVKQRGELDNTIVVYASDHGEMLGEHGRWGKSCYYEASTRIPLIIAGPGMQTSVSSDALVSLHDLAATFIDASGARPMPDMEARSLRALLTGKSHTHRDLAVTGLDNWRAAIDDRYKLVVYKDDQPILYDLQQDPREDQNIAPQHPDIVARLSAALAASVKD